MLIKNQNITQNHRIIPCFSASIIYPLHKYCGGKKRSCTSHLHAFVKEGKRKRLPPKHRFRILSLLLEQLVAQQLPCSEVGCCCLWTQDSVCSCFFRDAASCLPIRAASYKVGLALLEGYPVNLN